MVGLAVAEHGYVPDWLIRRGIRRLLRQRLHEEIRGRREVNGIELESFARELRSSPMVVRPDKANDQHYEVPAEFFETVLGPRLKYSCGYWPGQDADLEQAEEAMLSLTCDRAELEDGMAVLDLGCGWGSLSLWIAENYPNCQVTAVSNSHAQRAFIESRCERLGLHNVRVLTTNIDDLQLDRRFDRILSVEMFEHVRNYQLLLSRIRSWLAEEGRLFVHIFCHRDVAYKFEDRGRSDWMSRHFFTGGIMPAEDLLRHFQDDLTLERNWRVSGTHYARTCEAWLRNLDRHRNELLGTLAESSTEARATLQLQRWRMFFMACSELFGYRGGEEWFVGHYRFRSREF